LSGLRAETQAHRAVKGRVAKVPRSCGMTGGDACWNVAGQPRGASRRFEPVSVKSAGNLRTVGAHGSLLCESQLSCDRYLEAPVAGSMIVPSEGRVMKCGSEAQEGRARQHGLVAGEEKAVERRLFFGSPWSDRKVWIPSGRRTGNPRSAAGSPVLSREGSALVSPA